MCRIGGLPALVLGVALASCVTTPRPHLPGSKQELVIRTDPPGAACSVLYQGELVASVAATPGAAALPLEFYRPGTKDGPPVETIPPLLVICRKEGYIDYQKTFALAWKHDVALETSVRRELVPAEAAAGAVAGAAVVGAMVAAPLVIMAVPAAAVPLAVAAGAGAIATKDAPRGSLYAYRSLPVFVLTPATFDSEAACDAHFATLKTKLEMARNEERARIDAECRFYPCKPSDPSPCPDPVCERLRAFADENLERELTRIPELRAQVRIIAP